MALKEAMLKCYDPPTEEERAEPGSDEDLGRELRLSKARERIADDELAIALALNKAGEEQDRHPTPSQL
eukprot:1351436-Pleurochrysis_carterae.AAC.1